MSYGYLNRKRKIINPFQTSKYVLFYRFWSTSGSTGTPKAVKKDIFTCLKRIYYLSFSIQVPITHENFTACITSFKDLSIFDENDVVIQMTQCSFDVHMLECLGTLILGGS